jgi:hypothetical protein
MISRSLTLASTFSKIHALIPYNKIKYIFFQIILFIIPTKYNVLINTNIKWASPTCFGISVPSSWRTKCRFWKPVASGNWYKVLQAVAASLLAFLKLAFCSPWRWCTCTETCWRCCFNIALIKTVHFFCVINGVPVPVAARSKAWVCGLSRAEIVGSNSTGSMDVCCECWVLSGRGLCDGTITRSKESYQLWCVFVCDLETSWIRRPWLTGGCCAKRKTVYFDIKIDGMENLKIYFACLMVSCICLSNYNR